MTGWKDGIDRVSGTTRSGNDGMRVRGWLSPKDPNYKSQRFFRAIFSGDRHGKRQILIMIKQVRYE